MELSQKIPARHLEEKIAPIWLRRFKPDTDQVALSSGKPVDGDACFGKPAWLENVLESPVPIARTRQRGLEWPLSCRGR